jgi:Thioredoxin domain-containing protein
MNKSRCFSHVKELVKSLACLVLIAGMPGFFCACKKKEEAKVNYQQFLGDYYYDCSVSAMVFETPEGEEEPGILYRQVMDLNALVKNCPMAVCFFFYSGMHADVYGMFACMEQVAEQYHDQVLIVTIDALAEKDLAAAYNVEALPEAIIIKDNMQKSRFDGQSREKGWTAQDLANWVVSEAGKYAS